MSKILKSSTLPLLHRLRRAASLFAMGIGIATSALSVNSQEITIGEGIAVGWGQFFVADAHKLWEKQGLQPKVTTFASGRLVLDALVGGGVLIGTAAETPVAFANLNGLPVRVIGTINRHEPFDVVAKTEIKKLSDLKGKRVGYSQGTNAHYYLHKALAAGGLSLADITAVSLTPSDFVTSLVNGALDAFIWTEPHITHALSQGKGRFHTIQTPGLYHTYSSIITLQSTIDQKPELLIKALKALLAADKQLKADPADAARIVGERVKLDNDILKAYWPRLQFNLDLDKKALVAELESQAKWAIENKIARPDAKLPDFNTVVVTHLLDAARK